MPRLRRTRTTRRTFMALASLLLVAACGGKETSAPAERILLPLQLVRLEPNTRSRLSYIDWTVTTEPGDVHTGRIAVEGTADALRFDFPGGERVTRIELAGYDAQDRLRAGGKVEEPALVAATPAAPAKLWFHLYDEFQAYPDSPRGVFQEGLSYLGANGTAVTLGGQTESVDLDAAEAFDPETGLVTQVGALLQKRSVFGWTVLSDGRIFIAGGSGDTASTTSAEIWDPVSRQSAAIFSPLSVARSYRPSVFEVGSEVWVVGGTVAGTAAAADIFNGVNFAPSTPLFPTPFGANYFWEQAGGTVVVRGWKGFQSETGDVLRSDMSAVQSTFSQMGKFHNARVVYRADSIVLWGSEDASFQCDRVAVLPRSGDVTGGFVVTVEHRACRPALSLLSDDLLLVAGGLGPAFEALRTVKLYNVPSNTFTQPSTPDGRPLELVYARNRPQSIRRADGAIIIVGGYGVPGETEASTPRYEVLVPSP